MEITFRAYVDESGDEGFVFERGSSKWFVLSAVVVRASEDIEMVKLLDSVNRKLNKPPRKPLHFSRLKHEQRVAYTSLVSQAKMQAASVLVHKPSITETANFRARYRLYFYICRYLLERVSWYCRDSRSGRDQGDGSCEVIFSNRSSISYQELREYFSWLKAGTTGVEIDWSVVKSGQIRTLQHEARAGLQVADAIASSFFFAVEPSRYGHTEDRYARALKPVIYCRGRYQGYGIKFWPREAESLLDDDSFAWFRDCYGQ